MVSKEKASSSPPSPPIFIPVKSDIASVRSSPST
jgi:hypothetical protein